MGFTLEDDELQTTPGAAARELAGKRVLALVMAGDRPRPRRARARRRRRRGGAHRRLRRDARAEPGLQLHEPRARVRRDPDGRVALLPAQEQVVADEPRADARLGRVRRRARVRDRRRGDRARQAEPVVLRGRARRARRRAGADLARHRRRRGRRARRAALRHEDARSCAPGSSGPRRSSRPTPSPDIVVSSLAHFPALLEEDLTGGLGSVKVGVDIIEIERIARALERPAFRERCFTEAERAYCDSRARPGAELRGALRRQGGGRQGARLRRALHVEGDRDRRPAEAGRAPLGSHRRVRRARPGRRRSTSR